MMARQSLQRGYVSAAKNTSRGSAYVIRYRIRSGSGGWVHKSETLYGLSGKKAAQAILNKRIQETSNRCIENVDMTVSVFLESFWRPFLDRKQVKPSTRAAYDCNINLHVVPKIGNMRMVDVAPAYIEGIVRELGADGSSPKTIKNIVALLQSIFTLALENDVVLRSPVRRCHKPAVERREKAIWTAAQVRSIIDHANPQHRALFETAALTGARLGELLGLQWKNIDLLSRKVRITHSLWDGNLQSPKTPSSRRSIHLGGVLHATLSAHKDRSVHTAPDSFVFCKEDGTPLRPDVLRTNVLYPALKAAGIPKIKRNSGFHTFRHSAASFINAETGNMKLAQHLLGHASLDMTSDVYTHISADHADMGAAALEKAIYGNLFATVREIETASTSERPN